MWVSPCSILGPLFIFHIHPENRLSCHLHVAESQDLEPSVLSLNADPDFQPRARHFQCPSGISIITGPKHYLTSPPNSSPPWVSRFIHLYSQARNLRAALCTQFVMKSSIPSSIYFCPHFCYRSSSLHHLQPTELQQYP